MRTRRSMAVVSAAALVALSAAACQPYFGEGATLSVTPLGQLASLNWTDAIEDDAGETVSHYGIEVNGTEVTTVAAASGSACVLTGLAPGATYTLSVTAYGSTGEWSGDYGGDLAASARVSAPYTNGTIGAPAGSSPTCVPPTDNDGDRLPNQLENNSNVFLNAAATGSNPNNADTDSDGIRDGDEVLGTAANLNLYGMGTRPSKKDLLFEYDWFDDNAEPAGCAAHSHRPTPAIVSRVATAFGGLTTANPDGTTGVNAIQDYGQGGLFTGGTLIADADGKLVGGINNTEFGNHKNANFAANREGYFHYTLMVHQYGGSQSSGQAELPGDDLIVAAHCWSTYPATSTSDVGNTIMHEVGHNLNLGHGGNVDTNYKPNYNSIMNYRHQWPGVDTNCDSNGDGVLSYSRGTRLTLNEAALLEAQGVCGAPALDWNGNGVLDVGPIAVNLNPAYDSVLSTLSDHNDHANLCLTCVTIDGSDGASRSAPEIITEAPRPDH